MKTNGHCRNVETENGSLDGFDDRTWKTHAVINIPQASCRDAKTNKKKRSRFRHYIKRAYKVTTSSFARASFWVFVCYLFESLKLNSQKFIKFVAASKQPWNIPGRSSYAADYYLFYLSPKIGFSIFVIGKSVCVCVSKNHACHFWAIIITGGETGSSIYPKSSLDFPWTRPGFGIHFSGQDWSVDATQKKT